MLDKVKNFYENEYKSVINWINSEYCITYKDKTESINNAIQRCLAVALFIQDLDVPFKTINPLYEEYRTKFYNLLEEVKK